MPNSKVEPSILTFVEGGIFVFLVGLLSLFVFFYLDGAKRRAFPVRNLFEFGSVLQFKSKAKAIRVFTIGTGGFNQGVWFSNEFKLAKGGSIGDSVEYLIPGFVTGKARLVVYLTRSYDYGIVQCLFNGKAVGSPIDLWSKDFLPTGPIDLGEVHLEGEGQGVFEIRVVGKNANASHPYYHFGYDAISLRPTS